VWDLAYNISINGPGFHPFLSSNWSTNSSSAASGASHSEKHALIEERGTNDAPPTYAACEDFRFSVDYESFIVVFEDMGKSCAECCCVPQWRTGEGGGGVFYFVITGGDLAEGLQTLLFC
jgi:hypothetical protein